MDRNLYFRLSLLQFFQYFIWGVWFVTMGTYLLENLQFNGREVGLAYGTTAIAASLTPFFMGMVADRLFAAEKILAVLHFLAGSVMLLVAQSRNFEFFYPALIVYTLLNVPTNALANTLCFHHIPQSQKNFPRVRVWGTIGWIVAGVLISYLGIEHLAIPMKISAGFSFLHSAYCLTLPHTPPKGKKTGGGLKDIFGKEVLDLMKIRPIAVLIIAMTLAAIPSSFYYSFVNPFLNEIGVEKAAGKMAIGQGSEIIFMLILPFCFVWLGVKKLFFIGLLTWGLRYVLFAIGDAGSTEWILYAGILLHGLGYNFSFLATQIFLDKNVPESVRGTAQGFIAFITFGIGVLIGSYIAGEVVEGFTFPDLTHNWPMIWSVPATIGIVISVIFLFTFNAKDKSLQSKL
ncbi:MAG: nucleoside permease [Bacteroidetes bacterium]|nr:nucleoside permease [Bacteroidota bacterium]